MDERLIFYGGLAAAVVVVLLVLRRVFARRRPAAPQPQQDLTIHVDSLGEEGPSPNGTVLEYYGLPMRLAAVVLAPAGRVAELPPTANLDRLFEAIVPGLSDVVLDHRPLLRRWPAQMSVRGFAHQFFQHVRLPGDRGRGTPWSSVAGIAKLDGKSFLVGLVLRAAKDNAHGQEEIEAEGYWLRNLRVRSQA
ncbi:MAG: hypothetical protein ACOY3P_20850 [Planctomycetota bacterium]